MLDASSHGDPGSPPGSPGMASAATWGEGVCPLNSQDFSPSTAQLAAPAIAKRGEATTREQRRSRRKRAVRARTISIKRMTRRESRAGGMPCSDAQLSRPATRGDCVSGPRPCPFISCRHHLYLDVSPRTGSIKLNFPDLEVWHLTHSCALDIADAGGTTLESVGEIMNLTRERIRQLEGKALAHLLALRDMQDLGELLSSSRAPESDGSS